MIVNSEALGSVATQASIEGVVIRCGCGDPDSHNGVRGVELTCPKPRAIEELGTIDYTHRNYFIQLAYRVYRRFRPNGRFWIGKFMFGKVRE